MIRKKLVLHRWFYVSGAVLVLALTFGSGVSSAELSDAEKDAIGRSVTNLFKATRKVISQSQKLINDKNLMSQDVIHPDICLISSHTSPVRTQ